MCIYTYICVCICIFISVYVLYVHSYIRTQCFFRCESNFISWLVCVLKEQYLMPGEEFVRCGDIARELYFVADGLVQLLEGVCVHLSARLNSKAHKILYHESFRRSVFDGSMVQYCFVQ